MGWAVSQTPGGTASAPPSVTGVGIQDPQPPPESGAATAQHLCWPLPRPGAVPEGHRALSLPPLMASNAGPQRPPQGHLRRGWSGWEEWTVWGMEVEGRMGGHRHPRVQRAVGGKLGVDVPLHVCKGTGWVTHRPVTCRKRIQCLEVSLTRLLSICYLLDAAE